MSRRAFTLVEVLAAAALLGLVAAGAIAWTTGGLRLLRTAREAAGPRVWLDRAIEALERDLDEAARDSVVIDTDRGTVTLRTTHAAAGGPPGWREARWSFDAARNALVRSERLLDNDAWRSAPVLVGVAGWSVEAPEREGRLVIALGFEGAARRIERELPP